jgi:3-hydroxyacyl-CoA dehydrogenase
MTSPQAIGVIRGGTMGTGIALVCALAAMMDVDEERVANATQWRAAVQKSEALRCRPRRSARPSARHYGLRRDSHRFIVEAACMRPRNDASGRVALMAIP